MVSTVCWCVECISRFEGTCSVLASSWFQSAVAARMAFMSGLVRSSACVAAWGQRGVIFRCLMPQFLGHCFQVSSW